MHPLLRASLLSLLPTLLIAQQGPQPTPAAVAAAPKPPQYPEGVPGQLMKAIAEQGQQLANLRELCDIIGAHLDSWDLGTGATDNGTGSVASIEALRALIASGAKPKRTIRVVLFSGEEQGLLGSKAYAEAHKAELDKVQAVIVDDMGTGRIRGWALQGREDLKATMAGVISPMNDFGLRELSLSRMGATDHASFLPFGVPAFSAWELANLDSLLPRKAPEAPREAAR